ncbi:MAG: hypothetical protein ACOYYF_16015 [Chloroflexota bacterium]|nr:hypothetical protein [Chloroflexota bacterium]MBI5704442.1 hypothetical protein [Chloroflexota bacterium]
MTKWEYMYAKAYKEKIEEINGKDVGVFKPQGFLGGIMEGQPEVSEFLEKSGQDGWEVVGICPASEGASYWRLILKRPIS